MIIILPEIYLFCGAKLTYAQYIHNTLDEFIGNWLKLKQAGKEANLVLKTRAGNAGAQLEVRQEHVGSSQQNHQQKPHGAQTAQQRCRERQAHAMAT